MDWLKRNYRTLAVTVGVVLGVACPMFGQENLPVCQTIATALRAVGAH